MALDSLNLKSDLLALSCNDGSLDLTNSVGGCDAEVYSNRLNNGPTSGLFVCIQSSQVAIAGSVSPNNLFKKYIIPRFQTC
jgi:hypothetical protein